MWIKKQRLEPVAKTSVFERKEVSQAMLDAGDKRIADSWYARIQNDMVKLSDELDHAPLHNVSSLETKEEA